MPETNDAPEPQFETEPGRGPWLGLGIGLIVILVVIGILLYTSRTSPDRAHPAPVIVPAATSVDPYAAKLELTDPQVSASQNFIGGVSVYVEGNINNKGNKTVIGATAEVSFQDQQGNVVQRQTKPVMVVTTRQPAVDVISLAAAPLAPGQTREFRITFEDVASNWNKAYPQVRIVTVQTQ